MHGTAGAYPKTQIAQQENVAPTVPTEVNQVDSTSLYGWDILHSSPGFAAVECFHFFKAAPMDVVYVLAHIRL